MEAAFITHRGKIEEQHKTAAGLTGIQYDPLLNILFSLDFHHKKTFQITFEAQNKIQNTSKGTPNTTPKRKMSNFLTHVGKYLLMDMARDWFEIEWISLLDTAYCNHQGRVLFLNYMSSRIVTFHGLRNNHVTEHFLHYVHKRNLQIDKMIIDNDVLHALPQFNHFDDVKSLQMSHCWAESIPNLNKIIAMYKNLEEISLHKSDYITDETIEIIAHNCPKLKFIHLQHFENNFYNYFLPK